MLMIFFLYPGTFLKIKTFPQCTPHMYILIYIVMSHYGANSAGIHLRVMRLFENQ